MTPANCYDCMLSVVDDMKYQYSDSGRGKLNYSEKLVPVPQIPETEPGPLR
jgi:hypothetical protein